LENSFLNDFFSLFTFSKGLKFSDVIHLILVIFLKY